MLPLLLACTLPHAPRVSLDAQPAAEPFARLTEPGPLTHTAHTSGYGKAKADGLVNFDNPAVALDNHSARVALVVHALSHPEHGTVYIDTGVPARFAARGIGRLGTGSIERVIALSDIIAASGAPHAVVLTHTHIDHILGLPDVPVGTPILVGPGEWGPTGQGRGLLRRSIKATFGEHTFTELEFSGPIAGFDGIHDLFGDGSLLVLHTPGHTPGSLSVVARTTEGGMLFTGDTSHTLWGWERGIEPGGFTLDHAQNARNLAALKDLAEAHDLTVWVGHETDGVGTGIVAE